MGVMERRKERGMGKLNRLMRNRQRKRNKLKKTKR
jgi:hypothetical protein